MYSKWIDTLLEVTLFKGVEKDDLISILCCLMPSISSYKKNENITNGGDDFRGIGIVVDGEVLVTKDNLAGDRIIMTKLRKKDIFGEIVAFSENNKWPSTVIASTDCSILFLAPEKIIGNCPRMCIGHKLLIQNMLAIVSKKALYLNRKIEFLVIKSIRGKISAYLLEQYDFKKSNNFIISLKRNELAEFLNVSRPSLSRELVKMKEEGIIDFYKASFKIIDLEKLRESL